MCSIDCVRVLTSMKCGKNILYNIGASKYSEAYAQHNRIIQPGAALQTNLFIIVVIYKCWFIKGAVLSNMPS